MTDFGRRVEAAPAANVLPKSGETIDEPVGCDGYYEAGWEGDRFTDNGDGTITDNATSLMWPENAADAGLDMQTRPWADQIVHIEGLTFAGHSDWRMCNIVELQSLVDWSALLPAINSIIQNAQDTFPWTSTTVADWDTKAFYWASDAPWFDSIAKTTPTVSMCVRSVE